MDFISRGGTPYNGAYGGTPPERVTYCRLQVCERLGISLVVLYESVKKTVIKVSKKG